MTGGVWVVSGGCLVGVWGVSGGFWWCLGGVGWCLDGVKDTFTNPGTLCPPTPCYTGIQDPVPDRVNLNNLRTTLMKSIRPIPCGFGVIYCWKRGPCKLTGSPGLIPYYLRWWVVQGDSTELE